MPVIRVLSLEGDDEALPLKGDDSVPRGWGGMHHGLGRTRSRQKTLQDRAGGDGTAGTRGPAVQARVWVFVVLPCSAPALVAVSL